MRFRIKSGDEKSKLRKWSCAEQQLGDYCLKGVIKRGGMGEIQAGRHCPTEQEVAIKFSIHEGEGDFKADRIVQEARFASRLHHPNTIQVLDLGRDRKGGFFYVMEYLRGLDLQEFVERFGPLPPERVVFILKQICGSLTEMHAQGIVHRDIKPGNIHLGNQGGIYDFVKVLDFGLAENIVSRDDVANGELKKISGTLRYISPESLLGDKKLTAGADLYSLGAVAYWLLTGRPPFISDSIVDLLHEQLERNPQNPSQVSEMTIPESLDSIVMKCLAKDPKDRFGSAHELREALNALCFEDAWSREKAQYWWELHGLTEQQSHDENQHNRCTCN